MHGETLIPTSSHFKATSALISKYPSYWIIQTDAFPVFRFRNTPSVFFRATVDFCDSGSGHCLDVSTRAVSLCLYLSRELSIRRLADTLCNDDIV